MDRGQLNQLLESDEVIVCCSAGSHSILICYVSKEVHGFGNTCDYMMKNRSKNGLSVVIILIIINLITNFLHICYTKCSMIIC